MMKAIFARSSGYRCDCISRVSEHCSRNPLQSSAAPEYGAGMAMGLAYTGGEETAVAAAETLAGVAEPAALARARRSASASSSTGSRELILLVQAVLVRYSVMNEDGGSDFCYLTLDPNTTHRTLILSEKNRVVRVSGREQKYSDHPERFDYWSQVLCKESVCGRCYWEVEWSGDVGVYISVSYKDISRKGRGDECGFGLNNQSWSLWCSSSSLSFHHNNIKTDLRVPSPSRIGVYVDHSAGTLSFYSVSDTMKLLHRVHTTFTQPLYAGFWVGYGSYVRLCGPE
ncbi:hypothetical protein QTP86_034651 [Hemibagrus guttatus]|nr:hypothetical protein QTP86_034651 [Hemibagrus guttatus]